MVAAAIAGSQIDHLIDVIENPTLSENGMHHEWGRHTANGQAVRTHGCIKVVCGFPPSSAVHVLHYNGGISGNIFLEKRNNGFGPHAPDSAGPATLENSDGFPLEERSLCKSDAPMKRPSSNAPRDICRNTPNLNASCLIGPPQ